MGKSTHQPLPESLQYLQPFVDVLSKLPPEELNEDLDSSLLDSALRERLRGLDSEAAAEAVSADCEELQRWLKSFDSRMHPAHWVLGSLSYLSTSGNVEQLLKAPEPPPPLATVDFEPPAGWKMTRAPYGMINPKKGKLIGVIKAIDQFSFELRTKQLSLADANVLAAPGMQATHEEKHIQFGDVGGNKRVYRQMTPLRWKRVDYLLRVPGGLVDATLDAMGADFDETPFEANLHTLRVS
jgi:hypothetical protein